jgi:hypothetical protein
MALLHAAAPLLRSLFWAVVATTLILIGLPAVLNAAALR